jgi:plasmid stability protein
MATLTIRGLDDETRDRLRVRAARHGRSMEAEARAILDEQVAGTPVGNGLGSHIRERFASLLADDGLPVPPRVGSAGAATLDE